MLPPEANAVLTETADEFGVTKVQMVSRVLLWFSQQQRPMQLYVLGMLGERADDVREMIEAIGKGVSELQRQGPEAKGEQKRGARGDRP